MNSPTTDTVPAVRDSGAAQDMQRLGGIAAHIVAGTYVIGLLTMLAYLVPRGFTDPLTDPAASLEFLSSHATVLLAWYVVLYLVGGAALTVLVLALGARLRPAQPTLATIGQAFGVIWSGLLLGSGMIALVGHRAVLDFAGDDSPASIGSWHAISVVQDALGGGIEVVGASWLLLNGFAGLLSRALPTGLAVLGVVLGVGGLWTIMPAAADGGAFLFGVGLIFWFTWTAHTLRAGTNGARRPAAGAV